MRQDTVATEKGIVSQHTVPSGAVNAAEIPLPSLAERKAIEILPHDTETIMVGFAANACFRPIKATGFPFAPPIASNIKLFWYTTAVANIANHPVTQIA